MAKANGYDLSSSMVKLACETFAEKALIPAFVFFFLKLYPPTWVASQSFRTAGAAGGCILIRSETLHKIGGLAAIRSEIIDDCALAREVKRSGCGIWMGLTAMTESIRSYGTFGEIERMISRTAFNQLRHSFLLLIGTVVGLIFAYLLPPLLLVTGKLPAIDPSGIFASAADELCIFTNRAILQTTPASEFHPSDRRLLLHGSYFDSALQYWRGLGGVWKGRIQDARW